MGDRKLAATGGDYHRDARRKQRIARVRVLSVIEVAVGDHDQHRQRSRCMHVVIGNRDSSGGRRSELIRRAGRERQDGGFVCFDGGVVDRRQSDVGERRTDRDHDRRRQRVEVRAVRRCATDRVVHGQSGSPRTRASHSEDAAIAVQFSGSGVGRGDRDRRQNGSCPNVVAGDVDGRGADGPEVVGRSVSQADDHGFNGFDAAVVDRSDRDRRRRRTPVEEDESAQWNEIPAGRQCSRRRGAAGGVANGQRAVQSPAASQREGAGIRAGFSRVGIGRGDRDTRRHRRRCNVVVGDIDASRSTRPRAVLRRGT